MIEISTDAARLDVALIHDFLSNESHWARGITRERVERALANSLCFGGYLDGDPAATVGSDLACIVTNPCRGPVRRPTPGLTASRIA